MSELARTSIAAGEYFYTSTGSHSDYMVVGFWKANRKISREEFVNNGCTSGGMPKLVSDGSIQKIDVVEVSVGLDRHDRPFVEFYSP